MTWLPASTRSCLVRSLPRSGHREARPGASRRPGTRSRSSLRRPEATPCPVGRRSGRWTCARGIPSRSWSRLERRPRTSRASGRMSPPAPVLLALGAGSLAQPDQRLDLIRGRVDSAAPSPDRRRTAVRTNQEGVDFQPPASAQAWRDRAAQLREQMLVTLGLWPMPPKTPLNPQVYGKVERDGYTIEKVVLETLPGLHAQRQPLPAGEAAGQGPGPALPARPLGRRPRQSRGPAALHSLGEARRGRLHVRHGRLQRQQAVHACVPQRPPAALGLQPGHAPDLEQHPRTRLADHACRTSMPRGSAARANRAEEPRPSC